ncbi:MAG: OmpA family protein [Chitinophagaceae bacterium]|nr:MAG: OmpA family protein [Chitinophagaceae bacterium]
MKKGLMVALMVALSHIGLAQFGNLLDRAKQKTNNKINQKIDQKMDKTIDKGIDGAENAGKKKDSKAAPNTGEEPNGESGKAGPASTGNSGFKSYSKFDFVPGDKLVASEDFSQDALGDFPDKWNTNGSGEIVTLSNKDGKFLMTQKEVIFYPEWIQNLPENFTLEFDLVCSEKFNYYSGAFFVGFNTSTKIGTDFRSFARFGNGRVANGGGFETSFHPQSAGGGHGRTSFYSSFNNKEVLNNDAEQDKFREIKTSTRISIWRQKTRVRVYMDDKKVWDMPKALTEGLKLNSLYFRNDASSNENDAFYIGNVRLAIGAPDTRNKLITEGKFVSHGILFDVNSDRIKAESYGAIKEIATVLTENTDLKLLIVGHTDSDGNEGSNLELSRKRAAAVKVLLTKEFNIDASRMTTDGKGATQPMDKNSSSLGKANNRRVEFIKQ